MDESAKTPSYSPVHPGLLRMPWKPVMFVPNRWIGLSSTAFCPQGKDFLGLRSDLLEQGLDLEAALLWCLPLFSGSLYTGDGPWELQCGPALPWSSALSGTSTLRGVVKVKWDNKNMEKHVNYSQNSQLLVIFPSPSLFFLSPQINIFFL